MATTVRRSIAGLTTQSKAGIFSHPAFAILPLLLPPDSLLMTPTQFSLVFLAFLLLSSALKLWLALRQMRHVVTHRDQVPAEFAERIDLATHRKAADYSQTRNRLFLLHLAADLLLLLTLTLGGGLDFADQRLAVLFDGRGHAYGLTLFALLGLLATLIELPFSLYTTFVIEARFGFNQTTPRLFVADLLRSLLLTMIIGAPLLWLVLWLIDAMGDQWWLWVWLVWLGFNLLMLVLYPTIIAPLFNRFTPLPDGELKSRIEGLLKRCGFTTSGLFVMDGSRRTRHGNAYFTGFGQAKRIVFFDTLLHSLEPAEVEAVLAHELGHHKRHHVLQRIAVLAGLTLVLLWLLGFLMREPAFFAGLGVATPSTAMALALFSLVLPVFLFPLTPITSWLSRFHEYQADAFAAQEASADSLISALTKLYRDNATTLTPDPLHSLFYDSHPPAALRIAHLRALA